MTDDSTPDHGLSLPAVHHSCPPLPAAIMATAQVTTMSVTSAGGACAESLTGSYQPGTVDSGANKRLSIGSLTVSLWELAVKSAIRIASARNKTGDPETPEGEAPAVPPLPQQRALPPLPAVPPVGPGGRRCRQRSLSLTRSHSDCSQVPPRPPARPSPTQRALSRSQSMADLLSAMVAARLRPASTLSRSTHCQECNQRFSLIFRRHHCRTCQRSVCAYCSTYQRVTADLEEENEGDWPPPPPPPLQQHQGGSKQEEGGGGGGSGGEEIASRNVTKTKDTADVNTGLQRVCRKCASELEGKQAVHSRSWSSEFCSLRQFFKQGRHGGGLLDDRHNLPPKIPKLPTVCETIARSFLEECKKNARNKSLFQATSASFNAGLQYALKPAGQKLCRECSRLLRFPGERKTCVLCDDVFCRHCSSRDLALSMPDDLDPGDVSHEMAQVNVRVLSKEEAEELDKNSNTTTSGSPGTPLQRYRACHPCRDHVSHVLKVMAFNDSLAQVQAELVDLQEQICAVLDEQDTASPGIGLTRWPSVRSVHTYTCMEEEIVGEAVSERVAQKLLERYFQVYIELERLQPETVTQGVLFKHVKQAVSAFYVTRRSLSCKRFSRRDSIANLPPSPSSITLGAFSDWRQLP